MVFLLINNLELNTDYLKFTSTDPKYVGEYGTKNLKITTNNTVVDLPYILLQADLVAGIHNTITSYKDFIINVAGNQRLLINEDKMD